MVVVVFQVCEMSLLHVLCARLVCYYFSVWCNNLKQVRIDFHRHVNEKVVRTKQFHSHFKLLSY